MSLPTGLDRLCVMPPELLVTTLVAKMPGRVELTGGVVCSKRLTRANLVFLMTCCNLHIGLKMLHDILGSIRAEW